MQSTLHPTAWAALQPFGSDLQHRWSTNNCTELSLPLLRREDSLQHPPVPGAERVFTGCKQGWCFLVLLLSSKKMLTRTFRAGLSSTAS